MAVQHNTLLKLGVSSVLICSKGFTDQLIDLDTMEPVIGGWKREEQKPEEITIIADDMQQGLLKDALKKLDELAAHAGCVPVKVIHGKLENKGDPLYNVLRGKQEDYEE